MLPKPWMILTLSFNLLKLFICCSIKKKVKKGSGSKTLPSSNSPSRAVESPTMGRRLPADPAEAIGTAVVKYNYQVLKLLNLIFLSVLCDISELIIFVNCEGHVLCSY